MREIYLLVTLLLTNLAFSQTDHLTEVSKQHEIKQLDQEPKYVIPEMRTCLSVEHNAELREKYNLPSIEEFEESFKEIKKEYIRRNVASRALNEIVKIPVIVHVIHNGEPIGQGANISASQVASQLRVLNEDFRRKEGTNGFNDHPDGADLEIEFVEAAVDPDGNILNEPGIHRVDGGRTFWERSPIEDDIKPQTIWDPERYLNIWTATFGGDNESLLGYAQFPSMSNLSGMPWNGGLASTDGVVVRHSAFGTNGSAEFPYNGGRTLTHEIGHFFGLRHVWGDADCEYEDCCAIDDFCDDTPNAAEANGSCATVINSCPSYPGNDMVENYMDYTTDNCMNIFTQDQKDRVLTVLANSPRRQGLTTSNVYIGGLPPVAGFTASETKICAGNTIRFTDTSQFQPESYEWVFFNSEGQQVGTFTNAEINITFNIPGVYSLRLTVTNTLGSDDVTFNNYINVITSEEINFPYTESFEGTNYLTNWTYENPDNDRTWELNTTAGSSGGRSLRIDNYTDEGGNPTGKSDGILSPRIDLSQNNDLELEFDVAYRRYNNQYSDTLEVLVSSDCGNSYSIIWKEGGSDIGTGDALEGQFTPGADDWVTETIDLSQYAGQENVHVMIRNTSGYGNYLYLDDIKFNLLPPSQPVITSFYSDNDTISVGTSVQFFDSSIRVPTSWSWEFEGGDITSSSNQNEIVTYNTAGSFDVALTATNQFGGNRVEISGFITVIANPDLSITGTGNEICRGESISLEASGAPSYQWFDEDGNVLSRSGTLTDTPDSTITYELVGYNGYGGTSTLSYEIRVKDKPSIDIGSNQTISQDDNLTLSVESGYASYSWNTGENTSSITIIGADNNVGIKYIEVTVTNDDGCSSTDNVSIRITKGEDVDIDTGLSILNDEFSIYPNPAKDVLFINLKSAESNVNAEIQSVDGRIVLRENLNSGVNRLSTSNLSSGIYLVTLRSENNVTTEKIRIE